MDQPPRKGPTVAQHLFAGITLASIVLAAVVAGAWVDRRWGTSPWGIVIGSGIGIIGGLYNFIKEISHDAQESSRHS